MTLITDISKVNTDAELFHSIVHGASGTNVITESGVVPSLATVIASATASAGSGGGNGRGARPRFGIYYNRLETIQNLNNVDQAARYIGDNFDVMILHYGLEDPTTAGHTECVQIIAQVIAIRPDFEFFGYIHTGTTVAPSYTPAQLNLATDRWIAMGCAGCFFDECEFAFGTTRPRLNGVLDHIHSLRTIGGKQALGMVNSWDHSDLYYDTVNAINNPAGESVHFIARDAVHHESLAWNSEQPDYQGVTNSASGSTGVIHAWFLQNHEEVTRLLRKKFALRYFAINTFATTDSPETIARAFQVCQVVGKLVGADAIGLTVKDFGASGGGVYQCPSFDYDNEWVNYVSNSPLIEWAVDGQSAKRGRLLFYSQFGRQWWTGPRSATLTINTSRTSITPAPDAVLLIPFKKGTVPFLARLMPFGNSSPANVKIIIAAVCWDGSAVAWNDGQSQATNFTASGDSTVITENHGYSDALWGGAGRIWPLPVYGRREIFIRGSFVAPADGVVEVRWSANSAGEVVIMTVGSSLEVVQK